jgi:hypothetical protein
MKPTTEQISKLPKFARDEIASLQRQRDEAVRRLYEMTDNQTPSPFYCDRLDTTGQPIKQRIVYFQSDIRMMVKHEGVQLQIILRDKEIDLQWGRPNHASGDICFRPKSYQSAALLTKDNMR